MQKWRRYSVISREPIISVHWNGLNNPLSLHIQANRFDIIIFYKANYLLFKPPGFEAIIFHLPGLAFPMLDQKSIGWAGDDEVYIME